MGYLTNYYFLVGYADDSLKNLIVCSYVPFQSTDVFTLQLDTFNL